MKIILASASPRRKELLARLDVDFEIRTISCDETYPLDMSADSVAEYISKQKAAACTISDDEICLTADTVVILDGEIMGKPSDEHQAAIMLQKLSGKTHHVVTGVTLKNTNKTVSFSVISYVSFKQFTDEEINYYISHYRPLDKAGAYGIQEWIGAIGVTKLEGSYSCVMGLPLQAIYSHLVSDFNYKAAK